MEPEAVRLGAVPEMLTIPTPIDWPIRLNVKVLPLGIEAVQVAELNIPLPTSSGSTFPAKETVSEFVSIKPVNSEKVLLATVVARVVTVTEKFPVTRVPELLIS